ncbi:hypothetical protein FQA39_LY08901 [Lamprigera yunnana]|nr:hypothetical protein FQA39_LY08901 [Lamprigera yunnana]
MKRCHSIESHLDETITADKIELASSTSVENKINDLIKPVIKNNRIECQLGEDIKQITQLFVCLSLDGSSNYKESIRRIMSTVMSDQFAVLFSYKEHKGKQKFYGKTISVVIINSVQLCNSKISAEDGLLKKNVENEIALWLSKAAERLKKKN